MDDEEHDDSVEISFPVTSDAIHGEVAFELHCIPACSHGVDTICSLGAISFLMGHDDILNFFS